MTHPRFAITSTNFARPAWRREEMNAVGLWPSACHTMWPHIIGRFPLSVSLDVLQLRRANTRPCVALVWYARAQLDVSGCGLVGLPPALGSATQLLQLHLSANDLQQVRGVDAGGDGG
jgi:hypothetical protein